MINTAIIRTKRRLRPPGSIDLESLPSMRGLYRRLRVQLTDGGSGGVVIAVCTGPACQEMGGHHARIRAAVWVLPEADGRLGCQECRLAGAA